MKKVKVDPAKRLRINKEVITALKKEEMMKLLAGSNTCPSSDRLCTNGHCGPVSGQ